MNIQKEVINLYIRFELPKIFYYIENILESNLHRKWLVPIILFFLMIFKKSSAVKYLFLDNRKWSIETFKAKDLAPFYPQVGDIPQKYHSASLENLILYIKNTPQESDSISINKIKYWMNCDKIPPIIVIYPPPSRSPYREAKGYILDGNHRAIAMALKTGQIIAYLGNKNNLMKFKPYSKKYMSSDDARKYCLALHNYRDLIITNLELTFIYSLLSKNKMLPVNSYVDIATGPGRIINGIEKHAFINIGLDVSSSMIKLNKKNTTKSSYVIADALLLPFKSNSLELITCFRLYINLSKINKKYFIEECKRILKKSGLLIFDVHVNKIGLSGIIGKIKGYVSTNKNDIFKGNNLISPYSLKKELYLNEFKQYEILHSFIPLLYKLPFLSPKLMIRIDCCLSKIPFVQNFSDIFVVSVKQAH